MEFLSKLFEELLHNTLLEVIVALVGGLFFYAIGQVIINWWKIHKELTDVNKFLESKPSELSQELFNEIDEKFRSTNHLNLIWHEFDETLIKERIGPNEGVNISNTHQAESFFTPESIYGQSIDLNWTDSVPGVLTGIGLLGTFIALYFGLESLEVMPDGKVEGIQGLINNLGIKFLSSIVGVMAAVVFMVVEKKLTGSLHKACSKLQTLLNEKFPRIVPENVLVSIQRLQEEQATAFKHFNTDLSGHLKDSFRESMGPTMEKMVTAIDNLVVVTERIEKQKQEQSTDAIEQLIEKFQEAVSQGANSEISNLTSALSSTAETLQGMGQKISDTAGFLDKTLESQREQMETHNQSIQNSVSGVIDRLETHSSSQVTTLQSSLNEMFSKLNDDFFEKVATQTEDSKQRFELLQSQLTKTTSTMAELITQQSTNNQTEQQALKDTIEKVVNRLGESSENQIDTLQESVSKIVSKLDDSTNSVTQNFENTMMAQNEQLNVVKNTISSLGDSIVSLEKVQEKNKDIIENVNEISSQFAKTTSTLSKSSEDLSAASLINQNSIEKISEGFVQYEKTLDSTRELWSKQEELHSWLDSNLSKLIENLNRAMIEYREHTRNSLGECLTDFDKALADALSRVAANVDDLDDKLGELTDVIDRTTTNVGG